MATYAQRKRDVVRALRKVRQTYRKADTAGEKLERELDRLILRKTMIVPEQLNKMTQLLNTYGQLVSDIQVSTTTALTIASE